SPIARAAGSTSRNVDSVPAALFGSTSTATRLVAGTSSRRSSSRFAANSLAEKIKPRQIAFRPGEAGDKTKSDRVFGGEEDDRDRHGRALGRNRRRNSYRGDYSHATADKVRRQRRQPIDLIFGPPIFDRDVLALDEARVFQAPAEGTQAVRVSVRRCGVKKPD